MKQQPGKQETQQDRSIDPHAGSSVSLSFTYCDVKRKLVTCYMFCKYNFFSVLFLIAFCAYSFLLLFFLHIQWGGSCFLYREPAACTGDMKTELPS